MEDKERANIVLRRIGEMPYFDPEAIVMVLVNEFENVRKEVEQHAHSLDAGCSHAYSHDTQPADYKFCPWCGGEHLPRQ